MAEILTKPTQWIELAAMPAERYNRETRVYPASWADARMERQRETLRETQAVLANATSVLATCSETINQLRDLNHSLKMALKEESAIRWQVQNELTALRAKEKAEAQC